jgi:hypothetical protein
MHMMSVEEFRDSDTAYLGWVAAHRDGFVLNIGRSGRGYARLHRATCGTITSRPTLTGPYIKICSTALTELDSWALGNGGTASERCGTCRPPGNKAAGPRRAVAPGEVPAGASQRTQPTAATSGSSWEIEGPGDDRQVWLWTTRYIPYDRLTADQLASRAALRLRVRSLAAATAGEILDASYAGFKPGNMDAENLLLYNIDATAAGCFRPGARYGLRFELAAGARRKSISGRPFACSYQYRMISPESDLSHWQPVRTLASFTGADLGRFPPARRLEQIWLAIRRAAAQTASEPAGAGAPFALFLVLGYPRTAPASAAPELVKVLIDGTVAAFQAHGDRLTLTEIAARLAGATGQPASVIAQALLDDRRAVLGRTGRLVHLRGTGVQWNPADHLCVAGELLCRPAPGDAWTLAGEIHAVEPQRHA